MRLVWILFVLLIMVLPQAFGVAMADGVHWITILSSQPAGLNVEAPMLIVLGGILLWLGGVGRRAILKQ